MKRPLVFLLLLVFATVVGCLGGDKPKYANVKGTVTYNGKPIEKGQITFATEGRPPSTMDVVDGKFNGQAMVGSNKVSVSATKKAAAAPRLSKGAETQIKGYRAKLQQEKGGAGDFDTSMVEYIPPEWGTASKQKREVERGVKNEFEFEIKGK